MTSASLWSQKRQNLSINPRSISILSRSFSDRREALIDLCRVVSRASLQFEKILNFSINPRKLSIFYQCFANRSEALVVRQMTVSWYYAIIIAWWCGQLTAKHNLVFLFLNAIIIFYRHILCHYDPPPPRHVLRSGDAASESQWRRSLRHLPGRNGRGSRETGMGFVSGSKRNNIATLEI